MAGLSRSKNLSERNLNLKTALQKLYAPGIENDIELFSLSSKITSAVIGGPEIIGPDKPLTQIYGLESQKLKTATPNGFTVLDRTKFLTRYYTFTNDNLVYFTRLTAVFTQSASEVPLFSNGGSVPGVRLVYGGRGYYFNTRTGGVYLPGAGPQQIKIKNVILVGKESASASLKANITFVKESVPSGNLDYLYRFTPSSSDRYYISNVEIADAGSGYIIPELLTVKEDSEYLVDGSDDTIVLKKQRDEVFVFTDPILKTSLYFYRVVNADSSGFFLYDDKKNKYVFLDRNTEDITSDDVVIVRSDSIRINNLLQFKFAGSRISIRDYGDDYVIGESISGELSSLGGRVENLTASVATAVQNTKAPTPATSPINQLGYSYNSFVGRDVVVWQRVIMRDQDFLLNPGPVGSRTGLTGLKLKDDVDNFRLSLQPRTLQVTNFVSNGSTTITMTLATTEGIFEGDSFTISGATGSEQTKLNGDWIVLSVTDSTKVTFVINSALASGTYTTDIGAVTHTPRLRVPGLFIKVGSEYFRAFSTVDKPFLQEIAGVVANPNLSNNRSRTDTGALSAESQLSGTWYSYSTQISQLAQRIAYDTSEPDNKLKSKNGAFYYHRTNAPAVSVITVRRGSNPSGAIWAVPLFTGS